MNRLHLPRCRGTGPTWLLLALLGAVCRPASAAAAPPNVILILADDLGWRDLGCQGSTFYETPNLDALARQGVRFTQAYAAAPVCSPSRAAILTGKYPARLGLTDWLPGQPTTARQRLKSPALPDCLPATETTLAQAFKDAGYRTASIGKWHLGGTGHRPENCGFDVNIGGSAAGHPPSYFSPYRLPGLTDGPAGEYLTDRLTDEAVKFIRAARNGPFFLYLPHYAVHTPKQARPELIRKFTAKLAGLKQSPETEFQWDGQVKTRVLQADPVYAAMVASLDESVGRVLREVSELGLETNTIVIFTSDNGGLSTAEGHPTSNAPLRAGKGWLYEGGLRVPLLVSYPRHLAPAVSAAPVTGVDLYPTVLALAGLPARPAQALDGQDFSPILNGGAPSTRTLFWHYPHYSNQGGTPAGAVRIGDFKLLERFEDGRVELFDLQNDPGERHDLAASNPGKTAEWRAALQAWRKTVNASMPVPNPRYAESTPTPAPAAPAD